MMLPGRMVLQHEPEITAKVMPVNSRVLPYNRTKIGHPVPGRTKNRRDH
jgi:hypothetical protein